MTIRRQYSLPNCTLVLEGLSDGSAASQLEMRPVLSMLMSAECYLTGIAEPLTGGRDFFESLVRAVSSYAQEFISGVHYPDRHGHAGEMVQLHRIDENSHRLTVLPALPDGQTQIAEKTPVSAEVDLSTVQLFDLVEAIDQFFADTQTLPELSLQLAPVSKRHVKSAEPVAKRALPAAIGVSSLALAAMAFFLVPVPEVQRPRDPTPQPNASSSNLDAPNAAGSGTPNPNPTPPAEGLLSDSRTPTTASTASTATATPTPAAGASPSASPTPVSEGLEASGTATGPITDTAEIELLRGKLSEQIDGVLKDRPAVSEELVYRVSVAKDGAIVGYKSEKADGVDRVGDALLSELLYKPVGTRPPAEPLADFRVVVAPGGTVQVSPW